jgi:hypothetical protein
METYISGCTKCTTLAENLQRPPGKIDDAVLTLVTISD